MDVPAPSAVPTADLAGRAGELIRALAGPDAVIRPDQLAAIEALVVDRRRALVVQRTGWGKSAVYFLATALLRERGAGPTLVVSPLLALMRDQIAAARRAGIVAETVNSANTDDWEAIHDRVVAGDVDLLVVSPERLNSPGFRDDVLPRLTAAIGLLVVDEAHCISDWGHDFRPDYRRIRDVLAGLGDVPVLACTATANDRVVADVAEQLGTDPVVQRGDLDRRSLHLSVVELAPAERLAWLAAHLDDLPGSGIVYTLTVAGTELVAGWLRAAGHAVAAYSGATDPAERERIEHALRANELRAVVATSALGMGFDKGDVGFVVHMGSPPSPIAYYQQVGRAGRAVERAEVVLLPGAEDRAVWDWFDSTAFPPEGLVRRVLDQVAGAGGATVATTALEQAVNLGRGRLEALLKVLDVDGAVERVRGGWRATGRPWSYDGERYARVAAARRAEQQAMLGYVATAGCRMRYLRAQLDDPFVDGDCGRCDNCTGAAPRAVPTDVTAARAHLRAQDHPLAPRRQWPRGVEVVRGNIAGSDRLAEGRALSSDGDGGWSGLVADVLGGTRPVDDELLTGVAAMLKRWPWEARPTWVTWVPSRSRPDTMPEIARRLGALGRLEVLDAVTRVAVERPPQADMGNSAHQLVNVWDAFAVSVPPGGWPRGPVLLLDDEWRSGWTMTVVGARLRQAGAGPVLPAVLRRR
ncbi:MAG: ATP-dependent DNA helicase RecQ [Acidimicrobiales bacterium]|nr:ATP-dependent DNA helicase RecQ [Acidimicrobiales bacterium]